MDTVNSVDVASTVDTMNSPVAGNAPQTWPIAENFMLDFKLPSSEGQPVETSAYHDTEHDRRSLILVFTGNYLRGHTVDQGGVPLSLLLDLARRYREIESATAQVLVVVRGTPEDAARLKQQNDLPFPVLADEDTQVHQAYGAMTLDGRKALAAVFVAGRYGKIYLSSRASDGPPLPTANGVLGSLDFIESRCPECGREEL